ncbi:MAG: hypothetical protein PHV28_18035, partial [Kiritimatiellae bacterium]|nr:hypothetical protein [Kiritimatiellia bacterium]
PRLYLGQLAPGTMTQEGGTNRITTQADISSANTAPATYELRGGLFNPTWLVVGMSGTGTVLQTGGILENPGQTLLGSKSGAEGNYRLENGRLKSTSLYVGDHGYAAFTQTGGTNSTGSFFLVPRRTNGVYNLWGGVAYVGTNGYSSGQYVAVGFDPGSVGTFNFGTTNSSGVLCQEPGSSGAYMTVVRVAGASGTVRGWGVCELTSYLQNSGVVIADGYGTDRDLDFSAMSSVLNSFANTSTNGWYARDHGRLLLPPIAAGNPVCWGDTTTQDLVNSVKLELTGTGSVTGALLAADHTLVNPDLYKPIGVWEFAAASSVTGGKLTFLYDAAQLAAMEIDESRLRVWRHSGASWVNVTDTGGLDMGANKIRTATVNPSGQFAVAPTVQGTMIRIQ